jgi:class 3 adenylate cyclase
VDKMSSLRNMDRIPSKRWSVIKDVGCMGQDPVPIRVSKKSDIISASFLPYNNPDKIIDHDEGS